jgi:hypothetical protein
MRQPRARMRQFAGVPSGCQADARRTYARSRSRPSSRMAELYSALQAAQGRQDSNLRPSVLETDSRRARSPPFAGKTPAPSCPRGSREPSASIAVDARLAASSAKSWRTAIEFLRLRRASRWHYHAAPGPPPTTGTPHRSATYRVERIALPAASIDDGPTGSRPSTPGAIHPVSRHFCDDPSTLGHAGTGRTRLACGISVG